MSINHDLHYLSTFGYQDSNNVLSFRKRTILSPATTVALQRYADATANWSNSNNLKAFTNQGTFELHTEATECKWSECLTEQELAGFIQFCTSSGYDEVLNELSQ